MSNMTYLTTTGGIPRAPEICTLNLIVLSGPGFALLSGQAVLCNGVTGETLKNLISDEAGYQKGCGGSCSKSIGWKNLNRVIRQMPGETITPRTLIRGKSTSIGPVARREREIGTCF
ncbi:MAG: hypothetical protein ACOCTM_04390 [Bacteroidota bacterium]